MRHRILSFVGFSLGLLGVLFTFPLSFLNNPFVASETSEDLEKPITITPTPTQEVIGPKDVSGSPTPIASDIPTKAAPTPTVKATIEPSKTIVGDTYAAGKYGEVQIKVTVTSGAITAVTALKYPDADSRSLSISTMAIPILTSQTLKAVDSSDIQGASGASYTSAAWIQSLQSIISQL